MRMEREQQSGGPIVRGFAGNAYRVDEAVFQMIKLVDDGDFPGGKDTVFGLAEGGVGLGEIAEPAQKYQDKVDEATDAIKNGDVEIPTTL